MNWSLLATPPQALKTLKLKWRTTNLITIQEILKIFRKTPKNKI